MTESKTILEPAESKMIKAIDFLREALASIRAGKASPNLLNGITVEYYGNPTPISQGASVTVPVGKTDQRGSRKCSYQHSQHPSWCSRGLQKSSKRGHARRHGKRRWDLSAKADRQIHEKGRWAVCSERGRSNDCLRFRFASRLFSYRIAQTSILAAVPKRFSWINPKTTI